MHGLFPLSVLVYFSFLSERKDRVEGGSLCSFTAELEEEVHLKEAHFIADCREYQEDHGETSGEDARGVPAVAAPRRLSCWRFLGGRPPGLLQPYKVWGQRRWRARSALGRRQDGCGRSTLLLVVLGAAHSTPALPAQGKVLSADSITRNRDRISGSSDLQPLLPQGSCGSCQPRR